MVRIKVIITSLFLGILIMAIYGCSKTNSLESNSGAVAFYSLKGKLKATETSKQPLDALIISDTPVFSSDDMSYYKWSDHEFSLKSDAALRLKKLSDTSMSVFGVPFVVMAGKQRIYMGALWYAYSSIAPSMPHIMMEPPITKDSISVPNRFRIERSWTDSTNDRRGDSRIYSALKKAGVLIE